MEQRAPAIERWFFYQDAAAQWKWARLDVFGTVLSHSGAAFASRDECVSDARCAGFAEECRPAPGADALSAERLSHPSNVSVTL